MASKDILDMSLDEINRMNKSRSSGSRKYGRAPNDSFRKRSRNQSPYSSSGLKSRVGFKNGISKKETSGEKKALHTLKLTTGVHLSEADVKELFSKCQGVHNYSNTSDNGTLAEITFNNKEDALEAQAEYEDKVIDNEELHLEYIEPSEETDTRPTKEIYKPPKKSLNKPSYGNQSRFNSSRGGRGGGRRKNIDPRDIKISARLH